MKRSFVILAAGIACVVFGCRNDDAVAPVFDNTADPLAKSLPIGLTEVIPLEGLLREPGTAFNSFVGIHGRLEVATSMSTDGVLRHFTVKTSAYAELYPVGGLDNKPKGWFISGSAKDLVAVKTSASFVKTYTVEGRDDGMELHISLTMNRNGAVQLAGMKLTNKKTTAMRGDGN